MCVHSDPTWDVCELTERGWGAWGDAWLTAWECWMEAKGLHKDSVEERESVEIFLGR